ncbi:MAG: hypothetical protein K0Q73_8299, partial [Paenibacillus sp.]|nr:hypothetical protein [Paenibacillus sp.]
TIYIQLREAPHETTLGLSRLGGVADLPPGWTYPQFNGAPLVFIGQLNLSHIQTVGVANDLPNSGILYFFYDAIDQGIYGSKYEDQEAWRTLYYDGDLSQLIPVDNPLGNNYMLPTNLITFTKGLSLHREKICHPKNSSLRVRYDRFLIDFKRLNGLNSKPSHQLLGHPQNIQNDVYEELNYFKGHEHKEKYILLLQVDTDEENLNIMWGDFGTIYFVISEDNLKNKKFEETELCLQCC